MKKSILIIDDDPCMRYVVEKILENAGYLVHSANHGKRATEILSKVNVDLIMVDLMMPEMDGLAFIRWLRQDAGLKIPILVQTAMCKSDTETRIIEAGANALIYKPGKPRDLVIKIQELETLIQ